MQVLKTPEDCQRAMEETPDCLLAFSASWCGPCQALKPHLQRVASESMHVLYVDVDDAPQFADEFKIKSVPTVLLRRQGQIVDFCRGSSPKALYTLVRSYLQTPSPYFGDLNIAQEQGIVN
jgi:thioredoxin 1